MSRMSRALEATSMKALTETTVHFATTAIPGTDDQEEFLAKCIEELKNCVAIGWESGLTIDVKIDVGKSPTDQSIYTEAVSTLKTRQRAAFEAILRANPGFSNSELAEKLGWARTTFLGFVSEKTPRFITNKRIKQIIAAQRSGSIQCPDEVIQALQTIANRRS